MMHVEQEGFVSLARYNSEVARGLVHTPEWRELMAAEQARFDAAEKERLEADGYAPLPGGGWVKGLP